MSKSEKIINIALRALGVINLIAFIMFLFGKYEPSRNAIGSDMMTVILILFLIDFRWSRSDRHE